MIRAIVKAEKERKLEREANVKESRKVLCDPCKRTEVRSGTPLTVPVVARQTLLSSSHCSVVPQGDTCWFID